MGSYFPFNYETINKQTGQFMPSSIKARNNRSFWYWERSLFQRASSNIVIDGMPDEWTGEVTDFIYYCLFRFGFMMTTNIKKYGQIIQPCTLSGQSFYYAPVSAKISNPNLPADVKQDYEIHKECEIIKLTPDYYGVWDIIDYYAEKLSLLDNAINMSLVNGKFAWVLGAKTKSMAQALKKMLDSINQGNPAVIYDQRILDEQATKSEPFQFLDFGSIKDKYLTPEQLQDFQTILNNFDTEIGIPTVPYQKKERMVVSEAESKQVESIARVTVWVECLNRSFELVNKMYGMNLSASIRYQQEDFEDEEGEGEASPEEEVNEDGNE